jgi:hypothetical protein
MASSLAIDVDPQEWSAIFKGLDAYFETDTDLRKALDLDRQSVYDYRDGERETVDIDRAAKVFSVYNSVPVYDLSDPEEHVNKRYKRWGKRVDVDDEIQKFVFRPFSTEELSEVADVEKRKAVDYRNASTNPPEELWEYCTEALQQGFETELSDYRFDIVEGHSMNRSENGYSDDRLMIEEANTDDIREVAEMEAKVNRLRENSPKTYSSLVSRPESLEDIIEVSEDPLRNSLASGDIESNTAPFMKAMKQLGVLEKFGGPASNYEIEVSKPELKALKTFAEKNTY